MNHVKRDPRIAYMIIVVAVIVGIIAGVNQWNNDTESPIPRLGPSTTREEPPPTTSAPRTTEGPRPPMESPTTHPFVELVNRWDRLYASIVAIPAIAHGDTSHPLHQQMRDVLTPDSPLWPTGIDIAGAQEASVYDSPDVVLTPGSIPAHLLEEGQRNGTWPLIHELLGDLPPRDMASDTARVRSCLHLDFRIDRRSGWVESAIDGRLPVNVTFRRVDGEWRLHTWEWDDPALGCRRCGPEPPTTANHAAYLSDPRTDGSPGLLQPQNDPPCPPDDPRR